MLNFHQLTTFVTVISEGSMTAAADKLYLTQPAVSQQIRNLEEELGVELLVRGVRQIKATTQGEILYEHARRILQQVQQAEIAIKSIGAELKGHIKIGTLSSIGLHLISPIIGRLMRHNPDLQVRVDYDEGDELIKNFKKGALDILILPDSQSEFGTEMDPQVESKFLTKEEMWLVASGKETEVPVQVSLQQLTEYPFVSFIEEYPGFIKLLQNKLREQNSDIHPIFESSNVGTLKRVIETGLGWGFLPAHSIRKQVRSGRMTRVHMSDFSYEVNMMFYFKKNSPIKTLCETFYQAISAQEKA
jgi:DNA-binding transcriptional LysR family regulator